MLASSILLTDWNVQCAVFQDGTAPIVIPPATASSTLDPVIAIHIGKTLPVHVSVFSFCHIKINLFCWFLRCWQILWV